MDLIQLGGGGHSGNEKHHYYRQALAPVSVAAGGSDPLQVGDIWSDTTANLIKRCTTVNPDAFVSTEGGSSAHNILSATHDATAESAVLGKLMYANSTPKWAGLAGNTTTTRKFLRQVGDGAISAAPAWDTIADGDIPSTHSGSAHHTKYTDSEAIAATDDATQTLTNKKMDSFTNDIDADRLHVEVRNESGGTLTKGTPIFVSGYSVGQDVVLVQAADSDGSGTMPAIGLIEDDIVNNATGKCVTEGRLSGIDTSSFSVGDILYVSTTAGGLTATKPSGESELIQSIGEVLRSHATLGIIEIEGAGRTNDIPNRVKPLILAVKSPTTLTISSGDITVTQSYHRVDGESAADDDLDGIAGGLGSDLLLIRPASDTHTITVKHNQNGGGTNNILLNNDQDYVMNDLEDMLFLIYDSNIDTNGAWIEISRGETAITLSGTPDYITLVGQDIVRGLIVLTTDVSGTLPIANGGTNLTANVVVQLPISAAAMKGTITAGAGDADQLPETAEGGTDQLNYDYIAFDPSTEQNAHFQFSFPKGWNEGTITFRFKWLNTAGLAAETVVMGVKALALSDDEAIDGTFGTEVTLTDTFLNQGRAQVSADSAALTIGGTPAEGDIVFVNVARKTGSDDLTGDARILELTLIFTRDTYTDA